MLPNQIWSWDIVQRFGLGCRDNKNISGIWVERPTKPKLVPTFGLESNQTKNCTYIWVQKPTK